jgi:hypothetical protein
MAEGIPRFLLVLTAIVAIVAISVGIRDYGKQQKETKSPATGTPSVVDSKVQRQSNSAKTKRARTPRSAADGTDAADAGANAIFVNKNAANTVRVQGAHSEDALMDDQNNPLGNKLDGKTGNPALSTKHCVPLPNVTKPEDVDAPYYKNWAREYWCYDSIQLGAGAKRKTKSR